MSVLQQSVPSLPGTPHPGGRANSALGGAKFGVFEVNFLNRELRKGFGDRWETEIISERRKDIGEKITFERYSPSAQV
jgi:hypothetical protein